MNTTSIPRDPHGDDDRSHAVVRAQAGANAWREVIHTQRDAAADHGDFYALAGEMVETLRCLDSLAGVLIGQVGGYRAGPGVGPGREVYDDAGANPAHRLRAAMLALVETRDELGQAERAANRFFSAISHIGVRFNGADDGEGSRS